jgi:predicted nucleic acid-binding protein
VNPLLAVDTSVAIPLLVRTHSAHGAVVGWWARREVALCGHAVTETYSVLTRLPRDLRLAPVDAARLLSERFAPPLLLSRRTAEHLPGVLAQFEISGGAVYDTLVALAAAEHRAELATRDARAKVPDTNLSSWASFPSSFNSHS